MAAVPLTDQSADWRALAACRGRGAVFYSSDPFSERIALAISRRCPVRHACLADVMATEAPDLRYGVAGGRTPAQRRQQAG
jgi:hypothetical protein